MSLFTSTERQWSERNPKSNAGLSFRVLREQVFVQDWHRNNCRMLVVEHVLNVLGTMVLCQLISTPVLSPARLLVSGSSLSAVANGSA